VAVRIGIYDSDHHYFIDDTIDLQKVQDECRERLKPNNYYGRKPGSSTIHFHKRNVMACAGYNHEEYPLINVNADRAATQPHTAFGTVDIIEGKVS
jgi:hypothetical protein